MSSQPQDATLSTLSQRAHRPLLVVTVMASMAMVAIEATIVSTAMPQIASDLGGLKLYSWVFSCYLLAQTAMTVVFGKLADTFGRRPMILTGIGIFLVGSLLSGLAWSMPALILFRLIQGVGAGAIQPLTLTIIADNYPPSERGRIQGYLASVWASCAVLGPMLGGVLIHELSWSWIFWINLPIGLATMAGYARLLHKEPARGRPQVDALGALVFTIAIAALMTALTEGATAGSGVLLGMLAVSLVFAALFVLVERRAADPMISFELWRSRPIASANATTLVCGMVLMGLTTFLPMFAQGVLHQTPVAAGLELTMIMVGWPVGATFGVRCYRWVGIRKVLIFGSLVLPAGAAILVLLKEGSSPYSAGLATFVIGLGMGAVSVSCLLLTQSLVEPAQRGSATASNLFARNLGSTLGAALFGAVLNHGLSRTVGLGEVTSDRLKQVIEATGSAADQALRIALEQALHLTFVVMLCVGLSAVGLVLLIPVEAIARVRVARTAPVVQE